MTEHEIQSTFFSILRLNETKYPDLSMVRAIPNGGKRHVAVAVKLKREGVRPGTPDVCVFVPSRGFHGAFIEFKKPKGKLTPEQSAFERQALSNGYDFVTAYSVDDALNFVEYYLDLTLTK